MSDAGTDPPKIEQAVAGPNFRGDAHNICLLFVLYTLQSLPIGFAAAMPIYIQNAQHSSFNDQAKFSLVQWPFSLKLAWAPLVDTLFVRKFGRRKSWLIPVQYLLGAFFFIVGFHINDWLIDVSQPNIYALTLVFFVLNFLAATQDVAVDGWALTLLKRTNISYASTCNSAGLSLGLFCGYVLPITLLSESFCNKWLRTSPSPGGAITFQGYLYFWGAMFMTVTTLVAMFKHEKDCFSEPGRAAVKFRVIETYKLLFKILRLPNVMKLVFILFTIQISFSAIDAASTLKLIDGGVTKDEIGAIELLMTVLKLFLPFLIVKCVSKDKPMTSCLRIMVCRLISDAVIIIVVYVTPYLVNRTGVLLITYRVILVSVYVLNQSIIFVMWFTAIAFFAKISDPQIGGTNMTLLTTISHLGATGSKTAALWLIDFLTYKKCSSNRAGFFSDLICDSSARTSQIFIDGFYVESCVCVIYGVLWYLTFRKSVMTLESKNITEWHIDLGRNQTSN